MEYKAIVKETLLREVFIISDDPDLAMEKLQARYHSEDIVLTACDHEKTEFYIHYLI